MKFRRKFSSNIDHHSHLVPTGLPILQPLCIHYIIRIFTGFDKIMKCHQRVVDVVKCLFYLPLLLRSCLPECLARCQLKSVKQFIAIWANSDGKGPGKDTPYTYEPKKKWLIKMRVLLETLDTYRLCDSANTHSSHDVS